MYYSSKSIENHYLDVNKIYILNSIKMSTTYEIRFQFRKHARTYVYIHKSHLHYQKITPLERGYHYTRFGGPTNEFTS